MKTEKTWEPRRLLDFYGIKALCLNVKEVRICIVPIGWFSLCFRNFIFIIKTQSTRDKVKLELQVCNINFLFIRFIYSDESNKQHHYHHRNKFWELGFSFFTYWTRFQGLISNSLYKQRKIWNCKLLVVNIWSNEIWVLGYLIFIDLKLNGLFYFTFRFGYILKYQKY